LGLADSRVLGTMSGGDREAIASGYRRRTRARWEDSSALVTSSRQRTTGERALRARRDASARRAGSTIRFVRSRRRLPRRLKCGCWRLSAEENDQGALARSRSWGGFCGRSPWVPQERP